MQPVGILCGVHCLIKLLMLPRSYVKFSSMTTYRWEIIIQGSDGIITPSADDAGMCSCMHPFVIDSGCVQLLAGCRAARS